MREGGGHGSEEKVGGVRERRYPLVENGSGGPFCHITALSS